MKRGGRRAGLLEQVCISPVAHGLCHAFGLLQLLEHKGSAEVSIVDWIARVVAGAPLGEIQGQTRHRRRADLIAHFAHIIAD